MSAEKRLLSIIEKRVLARTGGAVRIIARDTGVHAPWLFDFRAVVFDPEWLDLCAKIFWETYASRYPFQIGGMESGALPLISAIVMRGVERGTPVSGFFIRKSRKRDGLTKIIEGTLNEHPIILIDDLINSGQTFEKQCRVLEETRRNVSDIFTLLRFRELEYYEFAKKRGIKVKSLFTLEDFNIPLLAPRQREVSKEALEVVWRFQAKEPSYHLVVQKSAPAIDDRFVYFGADDGVFRALEQASGVEMWSFRVGKHPEGKSILSSPALHAGAVYFGAYDGNVYALEATTGKQIWKYADADWIGSSPSLASDLNLLFVGLEFGLFRKKGGIAALSLTTGELVWQYKTSEHTHSSPLYVQEEGLVIVGSNDGVVYAHEAQSGNVRWKYQTRGEIKTSVAYDPTRRIVAVASMDGNLYLLSADDGGLISVKETGAGIYGSPIIENGMLYVGSLDKCVYAIDTQNGKEQWVFETKGRVFSTPTIVENSLWIGSNDGQLYELNKNSGALISFFQATERIVNEIAHNPASGYFFVPTQANEVYCLKRI